MHRIWIINWDDTLFPSSHINHPNGIDWNILDCACLELKTMKIFKQILKSNNSYMYYVINMV